MAIQIAHTSTSTNSVTREQFARWSFDRDRSVGLYEGEEGFPEVDSWEELPQDEKDLYLEEADHYLANVPQNDWPVDILERLTG